MACNKGKKITAGGLFNQPSGGNTVLITQTVRWHKDIDDYMRSVTEAEKVDFPSRVKLYDLYDTILLDTHLSSVIDKRKSACTATPIEFAINGKPDDRINELLESPWWMDFLEDLHDTILWGNSLFQFYTDTDGWMKYDLVPRKNVEPIRRLLLRHQTDIAGTSWDEYPNLLDVGKPRGLGELIKDIPWVLYKRNDVADWAQFAELFGNPIQDYTYTDGDDETRQRILDDIKEQGGTRIFVRPDGSKLNIIDSASKSATSGLYKDLATFCNAEMSKHILGNTLTTEAGDKGTQALGTVQKKGEDRILERDKRFVLNVLNYQMTDIFENFGFNVRGGKFRFVSPKDIDPSKRIGILVQLNSMGLPLDKDQLYEEFGLNKPEAGNELKALAPALVQNPEPIQEPEPKPKGPDPKLKDNKKNLLNRFFGEALKENAEGALDW